MKTFMPDSFDIVMAHLKTIEPSGAFDFEFRRRLAEAVARKYEETPYEAFARRVAYGLERFREAIVPRTPVLVRAMAAFLFFFSAGLYVYSIQPAPPVVIGLEGVVTVHGPGRAGAEKIALFRGLREGDTITTQSSSQFDINLFNKYTVRVKPGTTIRVAKLAPRLGKGIVEMSLTGGDILIDIEKGFKGSRFIVKTDAGIAIALGTKFSVGFSGEDKPKMDVDVLEGRVEVKSSYQPAKMLLARQTVMVGPGQKTEVTSGRVPEPPQRLVEKEWRLLEELYQIGRKPKVVLLIKNTPDRARQLLAPCPIYISDEKPRELPADIEEAVGKIEEAINTGDVSKHLEGIRILERMVARYPKAKYNAQLLLYIGAYYEYVGRHQDAIRTFQEAVSRFPESQFAGIAQCAIGIIYEEKVKDSDRAGEAFRSVLKKYPNSLEAIWVENKLGIKKAGKNH